MPAGLAHRVAAPDPAAPVLLAVLAAVVRALVGAARVLAEGARVPVAAVAAPLEEACQVVRAADPLRAQAVAAMPWALARRPETAPPANPDLAIWRAAPTYPPWSIPCPPSMRIMVQRVTAAAPRVAHRMATKMAQVGPAAPDRSRNPPAALMALQVSKARGPAPVAAWNQTWVPAARLPQPSRSPSSTGSLRKAPGISTASFTTKNNASERPPASAPLRLRRPRVAQ